MSSTNESREIDRRSRLESILNNHDIPLLQPTTGFIISHIGIPKLNVLLDTVRKGKGRVVIVIRALFLLLSSISLIFATQNSLTGITLSGNPWIPLTDTSGSLIDLFVNLSTSYLLVPIAFLLGTLIMLGLDLPIFWLYRDNSKKVGVWIVLSSITWFVISSALGLFIETTITWGLILFPEGVTQIYILLMGGAFVIGMSQGVLFIATYREFIRATNPDFIRIEGRVLAVRDYLTNRGFIKWPYSDLFNAPPNELNQSVFHRENWVNWIRVPIFFSLSLGIDYALSTFGLFPIVPFIDSVIITLIGLIFLSMVFLVIRNEIHKNRRTYWSSFQAMFFFILSEGMFISLVCGFNFTFAVHGFGLVFLSLITLSIGSIVSENPDILNPIYFRILLYVMNSDDRNSFIDSTLEQLSDVFRRLDAL